MKTCDGCEHWQAGVCELSGEVTSESHYCDVDQVQSFDPYAALRSLRKRQQRELKRTRREAFAPFNSKAERAAFVPLALSCTVTESVDWRRGYLRACLTFGILTPERHDEYLAEVNGWTRTTNEKGTA